MHTTTTTTTTFTTFTKPHITRFTEHFTSLPSLKTNTALSESLRQSLISAEQTLSAIQQALVPVIAELTSTATAHRVLANYHNFYASRGLRDPARPSSVELGNRISYLREHRRLLEERLGIWEAEVEAIREDLLIACHMKPYVRPTVSSSTTAVVASVSPSSRPPLPPSRPPPPPPPPPPLPPPPPPPL